MFDNSPLSLSGNGTQRGPQCACVESGPLANWTINLGPIQGGWGCSQNPRPDGYGYNPRCIERTFDPSQLSMLKYSDVVYTIDSGNTVDRFAQLIELEAPSVHNYPHIFMGGTQIDVTFSSQDPWFFHHHCMLEFVFGIWQSLDFNTRTSSLPTPGLFDYIRQRDGWSMPTPNPGLDSVIYLSPVFENITFRDAMFTNRGPYCYRYE